MTEYKFAEELQKAIEDLRDKGITEIKCDGLIEYLNNSKKLIGKDTIQVDIERYKAELQIWVEKHKVSHASSIEMFKSVITSGQNALRTAFLMNGGATISMLAFLGKLTDQHPDKLRIFSCAMIPFVIGVLAITMASGFTYLSQWFYAGQTNWKRITGLTCNILAIIMGLASYGLFIWGITKAYDAFISFA